MLFKTIDKIKTQNLLIHRTESENIAMYQRIIVQHA
jgi:hypothetical protein